MFTIERHGVGLAFEKHLESMAHSRRVLGKARILSKIGCMILILIFL